MMMVAMCKRIVVMVVTLRTTGPLNQRVLLCTEVMLIVTDSVIPFPAHISVLFKCFTIYDFISEQEPFFLYYMRVRNIRLFICM